MKKKLKLYLKEVSMFNKLIAVFVVSLIGLVMNSNTAVYACPGCAVIAPFYWRDGTQRSLDTSVGTNETAATGTNGIAVSGNAVYVAGSYMIFDDDFSFMPCYWRDGTLQPLSLPRDATGGDTSSIAIAGTTVYITGNYQTVVGRTIGGQFWDNGRWQDYWQDVYKNNPCYWRDGVLQNLSLPSGATGGRASGITVSGNTVFVAGSYTITENRNIPCYWRNGTLQTLNLPSGATAGSTSGITVSGNSVYISGHYINARGNQILCFWRNGVLQPLNLPNGATEGYTSGIAISGNTVYVAGGYWTGRGEVAVYWRDGVLQNLSLPSGVTRGSASSIVVSDNTVYIAGEYWETVEGSWGEEHKGVAVYWRDGVLRTLSIPESTWMQYFTSGIAVSGNTVFASGGSRRIQ